MMTMRGPAICLSRFKGTSAPFDTIDNLARWAGALGYEGVQIPCDPQLIDLEQAAHSRDYCDDLRARLAAHGVEPTGLSSHLQGQLVAVHPAYDGLCDEQAPPSVRGNPDARAAWATGQLMLAAKASANLGLNVHATMSGSLAWPYLYPWPQRPAGLVEEAFVELARRWRPILDVFDAAGVDVAFDLHPGADLHDGASFERFLDAVDQHRRANILFDPGHCVLQQLDYLAFIDRYHPHIKSFHVRDAEFRPDARSGLYGGYQDGVDRPGRLRSPGDGQVDFRAVFTRLAQHDYPGWAVLQWECAFKHPQVGAREGAPFIRDHIIQVADHEADNGMAAARNREKARTLLGL